MTRINTIDPSDLTNEWLIAECLKRGINIHPGHRFDYEALPHTAKLYFYNDWKPSKDDHSILIDRLCERFDLRKKAYHITIEGVKHVISCNIVLTSIAAITWKNIFNLGLAISLATCDHLVIGQSCRKLNMCYHEKQGDFSFYQ